MASGVVNDLSPVIPPAKSDKIPRGQVELKRELGAEKFAKLPGSVVTIYNQAVEAHLNRDYAKAKELYLRLRAIPCEGGGTFDLASVSEVFRHNLRLLHLI